MWLCCGEDAGGCVLCFRWIGAVGGRVCGGEKIA